MICSQDRRLRRRREQISDSTTMKVTWRSNEKDLLKVRTKTDRTHNERSYVL